MAGPITKFTSVGVASKPGNNSNGLYAPRLNLTQIQNIPASVKQNGGIWYNESTKNLEAVVNDKVEIVQVGSSGQGDVTGPNEAKQGNIAIFDDNTGKVIADSGVDIAQVPNPLLFLKSSSSLATPNLTVNEIGNLGHIKFTNGHGLIFVDTLMPLEFIENSFGEDSQVCSLFTGGLPSSSSSPSALLELQSDSGALLLSRMTTEDRDKLSTPVDANGMLLFNTDTKTFDGFDGMKWRSIPQLNINGTLTAADPETSKNLATKYYVDTSIATTSAAKYIIQTSNTALPNAQVLGSLATGLLKNTTSTGVLNIATAGTDYYSPGKPTRIIDDTRGNFFIGTSAGGTIPSTKNTGVGNGALSSLTNGDQNSALGYDALYSNTEGYANAAFGSEAMYCNTTGSANAAFGNNALDGNTEGSENSAFGNNALFFNGTGSSNSAFGCQSLYSNIGGVNNSAVGNGALFSSTIASYNVAIGTQSLYKNTTGENNAAVGYQSLFSNTTGGFNCAFGVQALYSSTSIGRGTAVGYQALYSNVPGSINTAVGCQSLLLNTSGNNNSALGDTALRSNTSGNNNSAFGVQALYANTIGNDNSAFGYTALFFNSAGQSNVAMGTRSLYRNNADGNSSVGWEALRENTGGSGNCAFGYKAIVLNPAGNNNSAFGYRALSENNGSNNTAVGHMALGTLILGEENVGLGKQAGALNQSYSRCVMIGNNASTSANNLTNAVAIGYQASVSASNSMVLGGTGLNQLSVGIGITPTAQLQLPSIHANKKFVLYQNGDNDHQVIGLGTAAAPTAPATIFRFQIDNNLPSTGYTWNAATSNIASNELMRLTGTGFLGIGTVTPHAPLQFSNAIVNRKIVLFEGGDNDHQVIGLGTASGMFRNQIDSTSSSYTWNAGTSNAASNELMRLTGSGFLGLGTVSPNAPLQFKNSPGQKIIFSEVANNPYQVYSLGFYINTSTGVIDWSHQLASTSASFVWNAAISDTSNSPLMRLTGTGFLGIGTVTPHAPLQFASVLANRKIVLFENVNNDHQFYGLGVNTSASTGVFRFQIPTNIDNFIFYSATGSATSNELMRLNGGGTLYAKQSYASYYGTGVRTTTTVANTYVVVGWSADADVQLIANNYMTLGVSWGWTGGTVYPAGPQELKVYFTASMSGGVAGEVTKFAIFKNGTTLLTTIRVIFVPGAANIIPISLGRSCQITSPDDIFDVRVSHTVGGRTLNVTDFTFNISST